MTGTYVPLPGCYGPCTCPQWPGGDEHWHMGAMVEDFEPSGLDEFHPDTTHNPSTPS